MFSANIYGAVGRVATSTSRYFILKINQVTKPRYLSIKWDCFVSTHKFTDFNYAPTAKVLWQRLIIMFIIKCRFYDECRVANAQCWIKSSYEIHIWMFTQASHFVTWCFSPFYVSFFKFCVSKIPLNSWSNFSETREFCKHHRSL